MIVVGLKHYLAGPVLKPVSCSASLPSHSPPINISRRDAMAVQGSGRGGGGGPGHRGPPALGRRALGLPSLHPPATTPSRRPNWVPPAQTPFQVLFTPTRIIECESRMDQKESFLLFSLAPPPPTKAVSSVSELCHPPLHCSL